MTVPTLPYINWCLPGRKIVGDIFEKRFKVFSAGVESFGKFSLTDLSPGRDIGLGIFRNSDGT